MGDPRDVADSFAWSQFLGKTPEFVSQFLYERHIFKKIELNRIYFLGSVYLLDSF